MAPPALRFDELDRTVDRRVKCRIRRGSHFRPAPPRRPRL